MKTYGLFFLAGILLLGCAPGITRTGYDKSQIANYVTTDCTVAIKETFVTNPDDHIILGKIEAYEAGFSVSCDEEKILAIFMNEACALQADIINVTEVRYPNVWSTCFRAKAELIKVKDPEIAKTVVSDEGYTREAILRRVAYYSQENEKRHQRAIKAGIMGGILGGSMSSPK